MTNLELYTLGLNLGFTGMTASVSAGAAEYAVLEILAPADRNLYVTSVVVFGGANSPNVILQRGSSSFIPSGATPIAHNTLGHMAGQIECGAVGRWGVTAVVPDSTGFVIPSPGPVVTDAHTEYLPIPVAVPAGEYIAMIADAVQATSRYAIRWVEEVAG